MKKLLLMMSGLMLSAGISIAQSSTTTTTTTTQRSWGAQYLSFGPVIGIGNSWVGNMGGDNRAMGNANIGVGVVYAKKEHVGYGAQLTVGTEGYDVDYHGYRSSSQVTYLRLPLRAYYFFGKYKDLVRPKIYGGPTIGVKLGESDRRAPWMMDATMVERSGTFKTLDLGLNVGTGLNILLARATWLNLDVTYYQGLADVIKDPANKYNVNHSLGFSMGLLFGVK